jgi:hypothetical protein
MTDETRRSDRRQKDETNATTNKQNKNGSDRSKDNGNRSERKKRVKSVKVKARRNELEMMAKVGRRRRLKGLNVGNMVSAKE